MLSRVAENLYWMSRYLERAEHTARLIDVNLSLDMEQSPAARGAALGASAGEPAHGAPRAGDGRSVCGGALSDL